MKPCSGSWTKADCMKERMEEDSAGPWRFDLDEAVRRELTASLVERMGLQTNAASFAVSQLAREMGYIPGAQYDTMRRTCGPPTHRPLEIALISSYLHRPLSMVVTVRDEETVADVHIRQLKEDLARFNQRSGD